MKSPPEIIGIGGGAHLVKCRLHYFLRSGLIVNGCTTVIIVESTARTDLSQIRPDAEMLICN
jgi:hypothetical protein